MIIEADLDAVDICCTYLHAEAIVPPGRKTSCAKSRSA